ALGLVAPVTTTFALAQAGEGLTARAPGGAGTASDPYQLRVDLGHVGSSGSLLDGGVASEEIHKVAAHHHVLPEGNRAVFRNDNVGLPAHGIEPGTEFLSVRDSGR